MTPSDSHGQRRERPEAHEDDPTGIRDLLASLPDPGPMPQDLVERIGARLAVEEAHRSSRTGDGFVARSDAVVDLAAERSQRRPGRTVALLGAAAAGLLVATVAIGELAGVGPASGPAFDSAAQVPARGEARQGGDSGGAAEDLSDSAGGGSADGSSADGGSADGGSADDREDSGTDALAEGLSAEVVVLPPLGAVDDGDYDERIVELAAREGQQGQAWAGQLTEAGAASCWKTADPAQPWPTLRAAEAQLGGDRVVVLLGMRDTDADADLEADTGQAMVMPWTCTEGHLVPPLAATAWAP